MSNADAILDGFSQIAHSVCGELTQPIKLSDLGVACKPDPDIAEVGGVTVVVFPGGTRGEIAEAALAHVRERFPSNPVRAVYA